ncbi:cysteine hydrolase [Pseudomonas aeruginosa]|uniref:isochorismatase family cysteine hydrolase n=1 Tax=Pseudomonas aeruginosa TaxID=287 RepID=UPI0004F32D3A|nr:isochorismatase family cysteine hydrolase [Pseudomonas aeruginosa]MCS8087223.1 cysteine hydrolase [Pseudomonas aeruginosa]MCS8981594.1 cysteine hydrolase [Pseudomonas aeruginosa]MCU9211642.1 cysteine hydrolase [Pseudomonas aeruginosa]HCE6120979.1 cysteine hydrolase [Pseudomonas aeruginosa]HCW0207212.1 cysteine hydrolase [Pseudomonas aeruginosa]
MNRKSPSSTSATTATFGPARSNAWRLDAAGISLVRQPESVQPLRIETETSSLEIDLSRSLLVVVDMQNDFCHPHGWFAQKGISMRATRRPIPVLNRLLPAWRQAGAPVLWLNWGIRADRLNLPPTVHFKGKRSAEGVGYAERSPLDHGRSVVQGEWGAQIVDELSVAPNDICVNKHRLSGFWDTELDSLLRANGMTTLLFAGINTDRCVFSTLQDAAFLGYDCILLADACSTSSPAYVSRAIHFLVEQCHGFIATATALQTSLASHHQES